MTETTQSFEQGLLRQISVNLGLSYEEMSLEIPASRFSYARVEMQRSWRRLESIREAWSERLYQRVVLPMLLDMNRAAVARRYETERRGILDLYERFL